MSGNSVFESGSEVTDFNDTASSCSFETVIFNPTINIRTFQRSGSWSRFPPPHTPSPQAVAQTHDPSKETEELHPLGFEPRDPTYRIPTSDLIDTTTFIESTPSPYTARRIRGLEAFSLRRGNCRNNSEERSAVKSRLEDGSSWGEEVFDSSGIVSIGQRIAQEERAQQSRRVHLPGSAQYQPSQPLAWPDDTTSISSTIDHLEGEAEAGGERESSWILQRSEAEADQWRRRESHRIFRYNPEPSVVERMKKTLPITWGGGREAWAVCFGACAVM